MPAKRTLSPTPVSAPAHAGEPGTSTDWEHRIGHRIRLLRQEKAVTLEQLALLTRLTKGQLSRIENGKVSSPVSTLTRIASALGVSPGVFFSTEPTASRALHRKKGGGRIIVGRGSKLGHTYESLAYDLPFAKDFESYLMTIEEERIDVAQNTFRHPGQELLFMLEGEMRYRVGETDFLLEPGDSLFFEGTTPHGPITVKNPPARFLSIISHRNNE